jgi:hypothetical protein
MIRIVNTSKKDRLEDGINQYELRINKKVICRFEHDRKAGGLSQCLIDASNAVEDKRSKDNIEMYLKVFGDENKKQSINGENNG